MFEERCCAYATHQEFPDEDAPHKIIEYGYSLEYTRGNLIVGTRSFSASCLKTSAFEP